MVIIGGLSSDRQRARWGQLLQGRLIREIAKTRPKVRPISSDEASSPVDLATQSRSGIAWLTSALSGGVFLAAAEPMAQFMSPQGLCRPTTAIIHRLLANRSSRAILVIAITAGCLSRRSGEIA